MWAIALAIGPTFLEHFISRHLAILYLNNMNEESRNLRAIPYGIVLIPFLPTKIP